VRSELVVLALASTVALFACEQIVGIDQFTKCDPSRCDAGPDGSLDAGLDSASDALELPDGISEASSWARWPMPNTLAEVKLGAPDASLRAFDAGTSGVLCDTHTTLCWSLSIGAPTTSFDAAQAYCAQLQGGWRMPTRIEVVSLLDSTRSGNGAAFPPEFDAALAAANGPSLIWTSSYYRPIINNVLRYWYVDLLKGDVLASSNTSAAGVLCVR